MTEVITTKANGSKIWLDEEGILWVRVPDGAVEDLEASTEGREVHARLAQGRRRPVLVDISRMSAQTRESRQYYTAPEGEAFYKAVALLVGTPVSRVIGNFFIGLNKPNYPLRLFSKEAVALEWLRGFLGDD